LFSNGASTAVSDRVSDARVHGGLAGSGTVVDADVAALRGYVPLVVLGALYWRYWTADKQKAPISRGLLLLPDYAGH